MKKIAVLCITLLFVFSIVYAGIQEAADLTWSLAKDEAGKKVLEAAGKTEDGKQAVTAWKCFTQGAVGCMSALACEDPENKEGCDSFQQTLKTYDIASDPTGILKGIAFQKAQEAVLESHPELKTLVPSLTLSYQYFAALTSTPQKKTTGSFLTIDSITGFAALENVPCPGMPTEFSAGEKISAEGCVSPIYVKGITVKEGETSFVKLDCESIKSVDKPLFKIQGSGWGFDQGTESHKVISSGYGTLFLLNEKGETTSIFSGMKKCSVLSMDNSAKIIEADITAGIDTVYNINEIRYKLQKGARIVIEKNGKVTLSPPKDGSIGLCVSKDCDFITGKNIINIYKEAFFDAQNKIINSNDKPVIIGIFDKKFEFTGEMILISEARFSLEKGSSFKMSDYSGRVTGDYLIIDLKGDEIDGSGISFGEKIRGYGKFYLGFGSNSFDSRSANNLFSYDPNKKGIVIKNTAVNADIGSLAIGGSSINLVTDSRGNLVYTQDRLKIMSSINQCKKVKKNEVCGVRNRVSDGYLNINFKLREGLNLQVIAPKNKDLGNSIFFTDESPLNLHSKKTTDLVLKRTSLNLQNADASLQKEVGNKEKLISVIQGTATADNIPPGLLAATVMAESNFDETAKSARGASYGLMGLTKVAVDDLPRICTDQSIDVSYDEVVKSPVKNLQAGSMYLGCIAKKLKTNACDPKAWAAYNLGISRLNRICCGSAGCECTKDYAFIKDKLPLETKWHVMKVFVYTKKFGELNLNSC
ncbi:transglycosylase SLT domain-containing protein [Candidatus Woesearchaeota archaeon]|nr:transglycosylase SLT domain-containing protein [Candidatus Woesearchaeota archaeon]